MPENIDELLKILREKNITPQIDKDRNLNIKSPQGTLTPELIAAISGKKQELVAYLVELEENSMLKRTIPRAPAAASYPLSSAQKRLWVINEIWKDSVAYNIPAVLPTRKYFDPVLFKRAFFAVLERYEILRTVFREDESGEIRQYILSAAGLNAKFLYIDLADEEKEEAEQKAQQLIATDKQQRFDLSQGPLFRIMLFHFKDDSGLLYANMHHIISDAWSANILVKDLMEYYRAFRKGVAPRLPSLVIHYKDYAVWQQQQLTTPKFKKHQQYWHQQFAGDIPVLDLFAKISRPAIQSHNGYMLTTRINRNLAGKLKARCLRNNVSLFMGIIASLKALFYRYTGQEDMVIGIPATGRNHPDLQEQIGFYLNTLALRTRFSGKDTFEVLLKNVREITLAAYEHQDYPFDLLVEELEQRRDMSRSPLFDVMVILQDPEEAPASGGKPDKAKEYVIPAGTAAAKFDLSFDFSQVGEDLDLQVVFNTDIYDVTAITGLIHHYKQLLEQLTTNPATELYRLAYLSDREQRQLLHTFNNTQTDYERGVTLPGLFRRQVALQPDVTALVFENRHFTYRELDEMSGCLAAYLHTHYTLAPEDLIGIKLHRNEWLIIALLAVLKAGCAYVPVDPASPEERQRYFADDSGYKACIDDALLAAFREGTYSSDCYHEVREDQLAYVLYTSGSSGLPKGCMLEHKGLINRLRWMWERYGFTTGDIVLQKTTFTFDVSVWELFVPLCFGAKMVLSNDETVYSPIQLATLINSQQVTSLHFVPVLLQSFIENTDVASLTSLKRVFASGEALSPATVAAWYAVTDVPLYNLYGPTEASIEVSYYDTLPGIDKVPIGKPIANTHLHILDQYGQLVPVGVAGEIYIGGIQLARGYHHRPELTAERFIDHTLLHERLYRTGDLGRWIPDGNIEYLGRMDNQVKVRGYRIELGEIEHVLQSIPGISAAVVIARHQDGGGYLLSAYFTGETTPEHRWLRKQLMLKLPEYMVPAYFTQLEHFPLTPSGKVDRKSLPAPAIKATDNKVLYIAPRNETEAVLVTVCERLFKQTDIGVSTSFFDLGGDSIKAILLASQLKQRGYTIKVGDILKYPVLEELVFHVHAADNIITEQSAVEGDVVLMPVQQWFLSGTYQRKHHYNQSVLLSSRLPVEVTVLDQSLAHLVKHHDALRMVFRYEDGVWQQHNQGIEKPGYHLEKYDLREHADPEGRMTILCYGLQESINLEQGPLVKAGLFHLPAGDRLLLVIHHLVVDGVSWRILLEDLSTLYVQLSQGQHAQLPLKSDSFRDWGHQQQQQANSPALSGEWAYWTSLAAGTGEPLPLDMPSGANVIASSASEGFVLEENITHLLQTKAHSVYHTDINDILLSCLLQSVQEVFQQHRLLLTLEGHGREETGGSVNISRTVGWFTSMYPVLLEGIPGEEAEDTLIRVKDHLRRLPNKGIGYGMLRYLNAIGRERLGGLRPGDITFNYLGDFGFGVSSGEGEAVFDYGEENKGSEIALAYEEECPLTITGILVSGRLRVSIRYSKEQFHRETIRRLSDCYANRLRSLITTLSEKDGSYLTAGDLTYKGLSFAALQELNSKKDIVDIYALSPLQEGLYYHWLLGTSRTMYVEQMSYRLHGKIDMQVLQQSYAFLISRHALLRTSFHHGYGDASIQVVHQHVIPGFRYLELEEAKVAAYKISDREEGFNLHEGPGMRLTVLEMKPGEYEFIWTHHHILMDGWCAGVLINEFYQIYRSLLNATTPVLAPVIPYVNYIRWLAEQDQDSSQAYWESYLSGYEQAASIPFRKADSEGYIGGEEKLVLSGEEVAGINSLCRSAGITENTFMQGVWSYLLGRYNNTEDVVFGAVVSGRPAGLAGVENMIGLFINTIPVRVRYAGSMTALELLQQLQQDAISSMAHHYVKLSDIQSRSVPGNRLFDHILVYENYPVEELVSDGLAAGEQGAGLDALSLQDSEVVEQTNYDFTVLVSPSSHGKGIQVLFRYNRACFAEEDVQRISAHFRQLLTGFTAHASQPLQTLSYLTAAEQELLLHTYSDTAVSYDRGDTLPGLFRRQVELQPDATALVYDGRNFTYRELDEWSGRLASYLHAHYTLSGEELIGIKLHRSEWLIISLLAVLKSGCAYVPVDPSYPEERQVYIAEDSHYKVCIDDGLLASFRAGEYSPDCYHEVREDQLAYVLYTSGSTGQPKGCMLEHKGLVNRLRWMWEHYGFTGGDVVLQKTTFTFDVSVWELFLPLCFGCKMVLCDDDTVYSPVQLAALIRAHEISNAHFVPVMLQSFIEHADIASLYSLRRVFTSGEALPVVTVTGWYRQTEIPLYNLYGPTEASIDVSYYDTKPGINKVPIGKPVANTQLYILDNYGGPAAAGITGEIHIGGVQLARGYYNRPALTAEKFMVHPVLQERLYRTGDLGRWLPDGNIEYLGRLDDQVKIRGYRIELGEVEHAISHLPGIGAAVVTAPKQAGGQRTLAAYFTSENPLQVSQIRQQLLLKLPEYMVPAYFIRLEYFPLTSSGKVDRKALPAPDGAITEKVPYVAPRNEVEACLAAAYAYVLNKTTVSVKEHFFDAGGDSIKVITLINYLHQQQYDLKVSDVLKFPVLEDVAARINITGEMPHVVKTNLLPEYEAPAIISLSPNQRFYCHGSGYTNAHAELNVYLPDFDKDRFLRAYHQLTAAYDILRLRFIFNDNTFLQEVLPLEETKNTLTFIAAGVQRADVKPVHPDQPLFHLETGEIMRWRVVHGGEGGAWVNVAIHHIVTDNASNTRLIEAFMEMYKGGTAAPVKAAHYFNFIGIQQQYLESAAGKAQREYWQQRLEPTTEKRNDLPLQLIHHTQWIHGNRFTTMQAFCRQHHLLPSALVLSALYRFLRQSNEEKNRYTIGVVVNGADLYMPGFEVSNAIGQFMNMLPLQVALENEHDPSLPFLVQERYLEGRLNQQVPFRLIEEDFRERCGSELLLDGYLSYIDRTKETYTKDFEELAIEMPAGNEGIDTDLWCLCEEYHNSIVLKWYWKCYDAGSREDNSRLESIRKMNRLLDLLYTHTHNGIIMPEPLIDSPTNAE